MRLEGLLFYLFIFIIGPVIRGLVESGKAKKDWRKKEIEFPLPPENESRDLTLPEMPSRDQLIGERRRKSLFAHAKKTRETIYERPVTYDERGALVKKIGDGLSPSKKVDSMAIGDGSSPIYMDLKELKGDDVLKGIIMSEILGPPKSFSSRHF